MSPEAVMTEVVMVIDPDLDHDAQLVVSTDALGFSQVDTDSQEVECARCAN